MSRNRVFFGLLAFVTVGLVAAIAANSTAYVRTIQRGDRGLPRAGYYERAIVLTNLSTANDTVEVFEFKEDVVVLATGFEVKTASGSAVNRTISLGKSSSAAGSRTDFAGELSLTNAVSFSGGQGKANVYTAADVKLVAEISGDPSNDVPIRVWALVAPVSDEPGM